MQEKQSLHADSQVFFMPRVTIKEKGHIIFGLSV